ncbi:cell wall hydrolase [Novosphingobium sp. BL-8H]|uniref:cell wall hydrolase n=1 Tax=Novosphingobium sp. BL-8H TaxID=3127640 RepID=UPI0037582E54
MYQPRPLIADEIAAARTEGEPPVRHLPPPLALAGGVLLLALALIVATVLAAGDDGQGQVAAGRAPAPTQSARQLDPARLVVADPSQIEALTQAQAQAVNAGRPISALPNPPAQAFMLANHAPDYPRALACLTAAIYYEAAYEPVDGQRAVAQVVLNRVRHPLYPHTVCGVVFQGAERATGCQFTFTCDGSLARAPVPAVWARVRTVAEAALAGYVFAAAGLSTHYHADYVVPYWSGMMVKSAVIGQHAFYRMPDGYGRPGAFAARYQQAEPVVAFGMAAMLAGVDDAPAAMAEVTPEARPVLDQSGAIVGADGDPAANAANPVRTAVVRKGEGRWIIGMDGNRKASTASIGYESVN